MELVNYRNTEFNICHFQGRSFYPYMYVIVRLEDKPLTPPKNIDIITFFNNKDNAILAKQLERNDIPYINGFNSFDKKWDNRDKISYTLTALEKCASKIVIICDASDVLINTFDNIIEKFKKSKRKILFNATTNNYPDVLIDKVMGRDFMALLMEAMYKINQDKKSGLIKYDKPKVELPDCNKCGDYEYCAFHYDKCTGFIPGPTSYE